MSLLPSYDAPWPMESAQLPPNYTVSLRTWFSEKKLEEAFSLIREKKINFFSFQRNYAGMIADREIQVMIKMAGGNNRLRFVLRDGTCSRCARRHGGSRCQHVAALAMLCLREYKEQLLLVADIFPSSPWPLIHAYIHDRALTTACRPELIREKNSYILHTTNKNALSLRISVSERAAAELHSLYNIEIIGDGDIYKTALQKINPSFCHTLQRNLEQLTASKNESVLNQSGMKSKQQHWEASIWMHIARLFFLGHNRDKIKLGKNNDGNFQIYLDRDGVELFRLTLHRQHTWELLDKLSDKGIPTKDIPRPIEPGRQFSRVFFAENDIKVIHCCRIVTDNREEDYELAELVPHRYGSRYLVDDHLFSLAPVPTEEKLNPEQGKRQLSLFVPPVNDNKLSGFTIYEDDISDFVSQNKKQLSCGRHEVEEEILELKIVDMPRELVINSYREDKDWCYLAGWYELGNRKIDLGTLLSVTASGKKMLAGTTWLRLNDSPLSWFHNLGRERIEEHEGNKLIKISKGELLALLSHIDKTRELEPAPVAGLLSFLRQDGEGKKSKENLPEPASHLRSYQRHGTLWLYNLCKFGLGGILADDMGLGKTHQTLAMLELLASSDEQSRFLIVCPVSVLYHWPDKQETFFPGLSMAVYHGGQRDLAKAMESRIIITSYGVIRQDMDKLAEIQFKTIIYDEMHWLKNRKTGMYLAASQMQAEQVFGLTGTPVENRPEELGNLLSICLPGLFSMDMTINLFKSADNEKQRQYLQRLTAPFILRRTRKQVLPDLPKCSEDIRICKLSDDQIGAYRQVAEQMSEVVRELEEDKLRGEFIAILSVITRLKQICNHLCLMEKCTDWQKYKSGKWDEFTRLVQQCMDGGLKVVVFSQFTSMLDIIAAWLVEENIDFIDIRGSVAARERSKRIKKFNNTEKCRICTASLLAGGTGIDLTGAQVVIHYDRWWNPAKETQATARVHRLGQKNPVQVYKLVTTGTLEEKIHHLLEKKQTMARELIGEDDESILKTISRKELAELFKLGA